MIDAYLTSKNPFVAAINGRADVARSKADAAKGVFDTQLGVKYDNKQYPVSDGQLTDITLEKELQSGMTLLAGYRKAEGVQEYSNIKTGNDGEARIGVKLPVIALFSDTNKQLYRYRTASLNATLEQCGAQVRYRQLRYEVASAYFTLLNHHQVRQFEQTLLNKARRRHSYILKKITVGEFAPIERLEVERQILHREQRLNMADTKYETALQKFATYLDLDPATFTKRFSLPVLQPLRLETDDTSTLYREAKRRRPDLKRLETETSLLSLKQSYSAIDRYPQMDVALTGVHDFEYDNGFKIALNMHFPIEQRRYSGTQKAIQSGKTAVAMTKRSRELMVTASLSNLLNTQKMLLQNIDSVNREIELCTELEGAERERFNVGEGSQLLVNQRELDTLEAKLKRLDYLLKLNVTVLQIKKEAGLNIGS
ncbi:MAG TPA: TolC family protein, partial [Sulfuricurvum sp.]|nr:TolC family protein [Sulfuricurvum sp.]